jgi:sugar phosphate isomerase/epimerase
LEDESFEGVIDTAALLGYDGVELACWPCEKTERRYAGVSHLDVDNLTQEKIAYIKQYCRDKGVVLSSLAYYPNPMTADINKRETSISHIKKLILASRDLGINMITTFIGRDQFLTVEENLELFRIIWPPIIKMAEENGVKVAIENCPMLFGREQWPGGQNLATTPRIWEYMFNAIDSDYFGLNFDPSHFVWQMMDYIFPIYKFKEKIFHIHFKDVKLYPHQLNRVGIMGYPLDYMTPKLPGLGDVDWSKFVSALTDIGYDGFACVEVEDRAFENNKTQVINSLTLSKIYLRQFVI